MNGQLTLITDNMTGIHYLFIKNYRAKVSYGSHREIEDKHLNEWKLPLLTNIIKEAGFQILHKEYWDVFWCRNLLFRVLGYLVPRIRPKLFFVAKPKD